MNSAVWACCQGGGGGDCGWGRGVEGEPWVLCLRCLYSNTTAENKEEREQNKENAGLPAHAQCQTWSAYVSTSNMGLGPSPPKASRWRWRMTLPPLGWRQMWRRRLCSRWRIRRRGILVPGKFHLAIHNFPHWGTNSPPSLFQLPLHKSSPNLVSCPPLLLPIQLYSLARCLLPTGPVVELAKHGAMYSLVV